MVMQWDDCVTGIPFLFSPFFPLCSSASFPFSFSFNPLFLRLSFSLSFSTTYLIFHTLFFSALLHNLLHSYPQRLFCVCFFIQDLPSPSLLQKMTQEDDPQEQVQAMRSVDV